MPADAAIDSFEDKERAQRTVRFLRRSGLHARMTQVDDGFEIVVPSGPEEQQSRRVLEALEHSNRRTELAGPTGWEWARSRLFNLESVGVLFAVVVVAVLLLVLLYWVFTVAAVIGCCWR